MKHIAFVLKGYPRLSESFIAQEILYLENLGLKISIYSLRKPTDVLIHSNHNKINAQVTYLPEYLHNNFFLLIKSWLKSRKYPGYKKALSLWLKDLKRDFSRNRFRRFGQALVLANQIPKNIDHIHSHFLHTPFSVAKYTSIIINKTFSISAHAKDIWTIPEWEIKEKLNSCSWLVTCTKYNFNYLNNLSNKNNVHLVYHGIDLTFFSTYKKTYDENIGLNFNNPIIILSVGRLVEKKGYDILMKALSKIDTKINWKLDHVGDGPLKVEIRNLANKLNISNKINWRGSLNHNEIVDLYKSSHIFILPSIITNSGDRDGLPNVLMEAQSQGLPCISSNLPSIKELIVDSKHGLLCEPGSVEQITDSITELINSPKKRKYIGLNGQKLVKEKFDVNPGIEKIYNLFCYSKN